MQHPPIVFDPFLSDPVVLGEDFTLTIPIGRALEAGAVATASVATPATATQPQTVLMSFATQIVTLDPGVVRITATAAQTALWPVTNAAMNRLIFDVRINESGVITYTGRGALVTRAPVTPGV
jgi:hypothetical protein